MATAAIDVLRQASGLQVRLSGDWTLSTMAQPVADVERRLRALGSENPHWDLEGIARLDSAGAVILWHAWHGRWPAALAISPRHRALVTQVERLGREPPPETSNPSLAWLLVAGRLALAFARNLGDLIALFGQLLLDLAYLAAHPRDIPWREFSANVFKSGAQALPVTALIGFLIGIVLSYLSALQLKNFGADVFIVNLLGIGIIRELGPVLVAVLVAGRSGSAMTAQIGVMRVTEEIDALATMGISRTLRLVLPKVVALAVATPLLIVWCSAAGLAGGMLAASVQMDLSYAFFIDTLPKVVPLSNLWIGMGKGVAFGLLIALIACHFGLSVKPNTESLSACTTTSVVTSITVAILVDAIFAVLTRSIGVPL